MVIILGLVFALLLLKKSTSNFGVVDLATNMHTHTTQSTRTYTHIHMHTYTQAYIHMYLCVYVISILWVATQ